MADAVSVIVPVWNGRAMLERLLESLRAQTYPVAEILIVDNGSQDGAPEAAERLGARVIRMGSNQGFARAVNRGIRESTAEWLAIVNSDVELAPDWLERLMDSARQPEAVPQPPPDRPLVAARQPGAARQPEAWFVAGKILNASHRNRIDGAWDALCRGGCAWRVGQGRADGPQFSAARAIQFAPGTASLFRAELFRRVGLLDESFDSYLEDVEFGLRCACLQYSGRYAPGAVAYHVGSAALGKWHPNVVRLVSRNQVLLVAKYYPARILCRFVWPILVSQLLWGMVALRHGAFWAFVRGKVEGLVRFRAARRDGPAIAPQALVSILRESERDIRRVQRETGYDWYWRVYFALTAGGSD